MIAPMGLALHRVQDNLLERLRDLRIQFTGCDRIAGDPRIHHDKRIRALERYGTRGHFVKDRTQTIDVGPFVTSFAFDLFRRHVVRSAHRWGKPGEREPAHFRRFRDAEIDDPQGTIITNHDVLRFEVSMYDLVLVHVPECAKDIAGDLDSVRDRQRSHLVQYCAQSLPFQILRNDVWPSLIRDFNKFEDIRMIEQFTNLFLSLEPGERSWVRFQLHVGYFDRHRLFRLEVFCLVDGGHTAPADHTFDLKAPVQDITGFDFVCHANWLSPTRFF